MRRCGTPGPIMLAWKRSAVLARNLRGKVDTKQGHPELEDPSKRDQRLDADCRRGGKMQGLLTGSLNQRQDLGLVGG